MTSVANGRTVTHGGDVRMRVRVTENPLKDALGGGTAAGSAHARAIPDDVHARQDAEPSKVRNFVQLHGGDARAALGQSWPLRERPQSLAEVARQVLPGKGECQSKVLWLLAVGVGVFRLAVFAGLWMLALAVDSRKRAAVALALLSLATAVHLISRLAG